MKLKLKLKLINEHEVDIPGEDESVIDITTWLESQAKFTLKQIYEWGISACPHAVPLMFVKFQCDKCWQELLEASADERLEAELASAKKFHTAEYENRLELEARLEKLESELKMGNHLYAELTEKFNDEQYKAKHEREKVLKEVDTLLQMVEHYYASGTSVQQAVVISIRQSFDQLKRGKMKP